MFVYPVSLRYEITDAQLIMNKTPAEFKVETEKRGLEMNSHPIKIQIDNKNYFESLGIKSPDKVLLEAAQQGQEAVLQSIQKITEDKNVMLGPHGITVAEIAAQHAYPTITSKLSFLPDEKPEISWEDGYVDIDYVNDEKHIEFTPAKFEFQYIPYSVKIYVDKWSDEA